MLQLFCTFILFSYIHVCIELCGESHMEATVYKFTLDSISHFSIFVNTYILYLYLILLYFMSSVKYWSKVTVDLEF